MCRKKEKKKKASSIFYYKPSAPNPRPEPSLQGQQHVSCREFQMQRKIVIGSHVLGDPELLLLRFF